MTTKVVYFTVGGKPEQAEFSSDFPADEIKGSSESLCLYVHFYCPLCMIVLNSSVLLALLRCRFGFIQVVVLFIIPNVTV